MSLPPQVKKAGLLGTNKKRELTEFKKNVQATISQNGLYYTKEIYNESAQTAFY